MKLEADLEVEDFDPTLFKQLAGSLMYLCNTRPVISYSVGVVSRFMNCNMVFNVKLKPNGSIGA